MVVSVFFFGSEVTTGIGFVLIFVFSIKIKKLHNIFLKIVLFLMLASGYFDLFTVVYLKMVIF